MSKKPTSKKKKKQGIKKWHKITAGIIVLAAAVFLIVNILRVISAILTRKIFEN